MKKIKSSEITPEHVYLSRLDFLKSLEIVITSAAVLTACGPAETAVANPIGALGG